MAVCVTLLECPAGFKESGWGREKGGGALDAYLEVKCVLMATDAD
jgi:hypothetical protein